MAIRQPDEGQQQLTVVWHCCTKYLLMVTEGLTHLTLDAIAVNGMVETLLGNTNQQLYGSLVWGAFLYLIDGTQREGSHGTAATSTKQLFNQLAAD